MINKWWYIIGETKLWYGLVILLMTACGTTKPIHYQTKGKIYPADQAKLTHTIVLFEYGGVANADRYLVEIKAADCEDWKNCPLITAESTSLTVEILEGLDFGNSYNWRVQAINKEQLIATSPVYHFEISYEEKIDTALFRHRIVQHQQAADDLGGYVFVDDIGVLVNMKGEPVYCLPNQGARHGYECLQMLPNGQISYLTGDLVTVDINRDTILFKKGAFKLADGENLAFHHSLIPMPSGNYLSLGSKKVCTQVAKGNFLYGLDKMLEQDSLYCNNYGWVIELNPQGDLVWEYGMEDYVVDLNEQAKKDNKVFTYNGHLNSVFYEAEAEAIWVSLRDFNRVVKIDRASKKVVDSYGFEVGDMPLPHHISTAFQRQHSAEIHDGHLLVYDNGTGKGADTISSIALVKLPTSVEEKPTTTWQFPTNFGTKTQSWSKAKGDVDKIDEQHFLVSMGTIPRTFIVNKEKEVIWECIHETYKQTVYNRINKRTEHLAKNAIDGEWKPFVCNYSASWISTLFPNYFTCQLLQKKGKTVFSINNEGGKENHLYWQIFLNDDLVKEGNGVIEAKKRQDIVIDDLKMGVYTVLLHSNHNSEDKKTYTFKVVEKQN